MLLKSGLVCRAMLVSHRYLKVKVRTLVVYKIYYFHPAYHYVLPLQARLHISSADASGFDQVPTTWYGSNFQSTPIWNQNHLVYCKSVIV